MPPAPSSPNHNDLLRLVYSKSAFDIYSNTYATSSPSSSFYTGDSLWPMGNRSSASNPAFSQTSLVAPSLLGSTAPPFRPMPGLKTHGTIRNTGPQLDDMHPALRKQYSKEYTCCRNVKASDIGRHRQNTIHLTKIDASLVNAHMFYSCCPAWPDCAGSPVSRTDSIRRHMKQCAVYQKTKVKCGLSRDPIWFIGKPTANGRRRYLQGERGPGILEPWTPNVKPAQSNILPLTRRGPFVSTSASSSSPRSSSSASTLFTSATTDRSQSIVPGVLMVSEDVISTDPPAVDAPFPRCHLDQDAKKVEEKAPSQLSKASDLSTPEDFFDFSAFTSSAGISTPLPTAALRFYSTLPDTPHTCFDFDQEILCKTSWDTNPEVAYDSSTWEESLNQQKGYPPSFFGGTPSM